MRYYITAFVLYCIFGFLRAGAQVFPVGDTTITFIDSNRSNRPVPVIIYYPAAMAGTGAPIDVSGQFPVVVFGHGLQQPVSNYRYLPDHLVPHGFIVILPQTEPTAGANPATFAADILFVLKAIRKEGTNTASLFSDRVAAKGAIGGHSMGGSCSIIAASGDTTANCVFNFAAPEITPSPIIASSNVTMPLLVFGGKKDCVSPPAAHQQLMYDAAPSACKALVLLDDADHCGFASYSGTCQSFQAACGMSASIADTIQQSRTLAVLLLFLQWKIKDNIVAATAYESKLATSPYATTTYSCSVLSTNNIGREGAEFYPNPTQGTLNIATGYSDISTGTVALFNLVGRRMIATNWFKGSPVDISTLPAGHYIVRIETDKSVFYDRIVVQK